MEPMDIVVLEWTFSPPDYFEDRIELKRDDYDMVIDRGNVEAKIRPEAYDKNPSVRDDLHNVLNDRFLGVQLLTHKPYELSKASMYRLYPDGRKDITVFVEPCVLTLSVGTPDILVTDKDGNVISDSRRDRIEKKKELADLAEKYRRSDSTATSLLKSYQSAVNDPNNELVHLYEIRDALSKKFGGDSLVRDALNISSTQWSRFGQLANNEPLKQGRHRGRSLATLRDATEAELMEARNIARRLVEAYLEYLERMSARDA
ncbi:MAG: hypothetical protein NT047_09380 [Deltaproteobacteria bacterium]|nr:hypothetical protein [Deltaproteobacteria bacterium]